MPSPTRCRGAASARGSLEQLASHARASGLTAFHAWVLGGNHRMLRVFVDSGFAIQSKTDQGVIEVALSLEPSVTYAARSAERASTAARASLGAFFRRRRWRSSARVAMGPVSAPRF